MLILKKLHRQFPHRVVEWGLSYILISWGSLLLITPGAFEAAQQGAYVGWRELAPQSVWGFYAFFIGALRLTFLYINGAHTKSPVLRTIAGFFSMSLWFWATVGIIQEEHFLSTALAIYPWLMAGDGYAVYAASGDAYRSLHDNRGPANDFVRA
jgi:hypothetical protein